MGRNGNARNLCASYSNSREVYGPELKPCIRCVMICKVGFIACNAKIALLHVSMLVTYYIKLFWMGANRHNTTLISLLLLVAKTKNSVNFALFNIFQKYPHKYLREFTFNPFNHILLLQFKLILMFSVTDFDILELFQLLLLLLFPAKFFFSNVVIFFNDVSFQWRHIMIFPTWRLFSIFLWHNILSYS